LSPLIGAMGSNRLFASKSPSTVPLRSKITEPFQVSALACLLGLAHSGLESRRQIHPDQPARAARTFPKIDHENTPDSSFSTDFCGQSLRMSTAPQELCEILETGRCILDADGPLMPSLLVPQGAQNKRVNEPGPAAKFGSTPATLLLPRNQVPSLRGVSS